MTSNYCAKMNKMLYSVHLWPANGTQAVFVSSSVKGNRNKPLHATSFIFMLCNSLMSSTTYLISSSLNYAEKITKMNDIMRIEVKDGITNLYTSLYFMVIFSSNYQATGKKCQVMEKILLYYSLL